MKKCILFVLFSISVIVKAQDKQNEVDHWLPADYKVGTYILPTVNHYKGPKGGYVAVYSKQEKGSVYGVGAGIYVIGQIRLKGTYKGRIFIPLGCDGIDISSMNYFKKLAAKYFPEFKGNIWVGGDTGGWFGY